MTTHRRFATLTFASDDDSANVLHLSGAADYAERGYSRSGNRRRPRRTGDAREGRRRPTREHDEAVVDSMAGKDPRQEFQRRLRQRMREGWQLVGRSDEPPRARLRRRADAQRGARRVPTNAPQTALFQHVYREIWVDEDGSVHDEEAPESE
jgi:hypothetical protein